MKPLQAPTKAMTADTTQYWLLYGMRANDNAHRTDDDNRASLGDNRSTVTLAVNVPGNRPTYNHVINMAAQSIVTSTWACSSSMVAAIVAGDIPCKLHQMWTWIGSIHGLDCQCNILYSALSHSASNALGAPSTAETEAS